MHTCVTGGEELQIYLFLNKYLYFLRCQVAKHSDIVHIAQFKCPITPVRGMPSCRIIENAKFRLREPPTPQQETFLVSHSNSMMHLTDLRVRRILHNNNNLSQTHSNNQSLRGYVLVKITRSPTSKNT